MGDVVKPSLLLVTLWLKIRIQSSVEVSVLVLLCFCAWFWGSLSRAELASVKVTLWSWGDLFLLLVEVRLFVLLQVRL